MTIGRTEDEIRQHIDRVLRHEFPQIAMHGGVAEVVGLDTETGEVDIVLGASCNGCGISGMTMAALQRRIPASVEEVTHVRVSETSSFGTEGPSDLSDVPF